MQKKLSFLFILASLFSFTVTYSQAPVPTRQDSLFALRLYSVANDDRIDPKEAMKIYDTLISFSTRKNFTRGIVWSYREQARLFARNGQLEKATSCLDRAIEAAIKGPEKIELTMIYFYSSAFHNEYSLHDRAFIDATKAVESAIKINKNALTGKCYSQLARCYFQKGDYPNAISYHEKAIGLIRKTSNVKELRESLLSLSGVNIAAGNFSKALSQLKEVEKGNPTVPVESQKLPEMYGNMGYCYRSMGKMDLAIDYYLKTLDVIKQRGVDKGMLVTEVVVKNSLGDIYLDQGKYDLAEQYYNEALQKAKVANTPEEFKTVYGNLGRLAFLKKEYKKAYELQEKQNLYADSVMNKEKMKALESLSVKFQTKEIKDKNKLLEKSNALQKAYLAQEKTRKNIILYSSLGIFIFLITGIIWLYNYYRQKNIINANKNKELKQKLLITQMNPHFIFNSIDNIQGLIYNKQDKEAVSYLTKFSKLTRQILENSNENYILLSEELEMIENYIVIQQLLYNNKFDFRIEVEEAIDRESILLPPMLTQPFIENAIKHGLSNTTEKGMIDIRFYLKESKLFFEVIDNGVGFDATKKVENHKSLAMTITKERLVSYTKNHDFVVQTDNIVDEHQQVSGAKVSFEIPYIYEN